MTRILGIDPGSQRTGIGIIDVDGAGRVSHVHHAPLVLLGAEDFPQRLRVLLDGLTAVIATWQPDEVAIEKVFMARNPDSALKLGQARGAAISAVVLRDLELPLFGKTGTTTGPKDVWFIGGTQQMIAGAYIGFDQPRNMGGYAFGGTIAAPIIKSLIEKTKPKWSDLPAVAPAGVRMVRVDRRSGKRVFDGWPTDDPRSAIIWEAFKPDTEPERYTRQDAIAAKRNEILALIRAGRPGILRAWVLNGLGVLLVLGWLFSPDPLNWTAWLLSLWALPVLILVPLWRAWDVRSATPWLASLAMLALLLNNAWEGSLKGRPFNPPAQVRVDRIKAETGPTDKIWVDGIQPQYYLWTDRQPASAYLFFANVNPPYDVRERVLADIKRQSPKFIIAKPDRVSEELKKPSSPSHLAFYQYLTSHYEEVDPGLYRRR